MKILAPLNKVEEVELLKDAGADEVYCGLISANWQKKYSNIASANRREWSSANLSTIAELAIVVKKAHNCGLKVWVTLNAFYSPMQEKMVKEELKGIMGAKVDGLIVADFGIMDYIKKNYDTKLIISTCATIFNSHAVSFYRQFNPFKITLPRQLTIPEIASIAEKNKDLEFEVFILNSGCKNIDGFCTFHHGINEYSYGKIWKLFKKMNLDLKILDRYRKYPLLYKLTAPFIKGVDSACILNYDIELFGSLYKKNKIKIESNLKRYFSLYTGIDPCGACDILELKKINVSTLKIVGRNYSSDKKIKDIKFIKTVLNFSKDDICKEEFKSVVQGLFKSIYGYKCGEICYRN